MYCKYTALKSKHVKTRTMAPRIALMQQRPAMKAAGRAVSLKAVASMLIRTVQASGSMQRNNSVPNDSIHSR